MIGATIKEAFPSASSNPIAVNTPPSTVRRYNDDALAGVKAYLKDGYDARLIVEQLAVLRRAQRVRVPGRSATLDEPA